MLDLSCSPLVTIRLHIAAVLKRLYGSGATYSGSYARWEDARAASSGYDQEQILEKVAAAAARVARGEAAFERDSVTFERPECSAPILSALVRAAAANGGRALAVLDFGGSLGSSYFQYRGFLPESCDLRWTIVEQEHFVARGRSEFQDQRLHFCLGVDEAAARVRPDLALLSSVLQYLERPGEALRQISQTGVRYLLIDRTPLSAAPNDQLTVQQTAIYSAGLPCRIFSRGQLLASLAPDWSLLEEFPSVDGWAVGPGGCFRFGGMLLERRRPLSPSSA